MYEFVLNYVTIFTSFQLSLSVEVVLKVDCKICSIKTAYVK